MTTNIKDTGFQLTFPENQKRGGNLSTTKAISFDDVGNFYEERQKIRRALERNLETELRIDYSDFANHVFFDSAVSKYNIAQDRIFNKYPYDGTEEEKDAFTLTGSGYEDYIFNVWPKYVGYVELDGATQYVTASDFDNKLMPGSSSFYASAWVNIPETIPSLGAMVLEWLSASSNIVTEKSVGYALTLAPGSGGDDPLLLFYIMSGTLISWNYISSSLAGHTGSWCCVAGMYDAVEQIYSLYINNECVASSSISVGPLEAPPQKFLIGSSSLSVDLFSGSVDEVRVCHTASHLWHVKNYNRPIYPSSVNTGSLERQDDYLKLNYKFNEGITGVDGVDDIIVDYSKNAIHGSCINYSSSVRVSGTVMLKDPGDPILYSFHSDVVSFSSSMILSATLYDNNNNNLIFNMIPEGVLIADEDAEGLYQAFVLVLARFFDELKLYADQFDNLRVTNYQGYDEVPDLFLPYLLKYFGWKVTERFGDADPLAFFYGEDILASGSLDVSLMEIRNQFWRRLLNNLPYLLKTKGKRFNLDAYFNVLGINRENILIKEYGYLPGGSIQDTRIHKEKVVPLLGIGTGSFGVLSSSFVKSDSLLNSTDFAPYTVETMIQLPFNSASYSGSIFTGSVWQLVDSGNTESFTFLWEKTTLTSTSVKFILTSSDANGNGQRFSSSYVEVSDGDFVNVAAGLGSGNLPFIEVRTIDNDEVDFSSSFIGSVALSGVFTGSDSALDFVIGANSGSIFENETQGFYSEVRFWNRALSASELDDHALHFESIGVEDPNEEPHPLRAHWPLNESVVVDDNGVISTIIDHSRNGYVATGREFPVGENPYQKFFLEYNYLSPSVDLKWTENKVRIRNKSELTPKEKALDTNELAFEFNLIDALNEDISKIFSTFDLVNNIIGNPVNKYRDEYSDLESIRRKYFERLSDNLNFTNFFKLFKWFDKKLSDSIKQLLPARVRFVGGEQVVESHFLERSKYGYKYPIFRTPQEVPEFTISSSYQFSYDKMQVFEVDDPTRSAYVQGLQERYSPTTKIRPSSVSSEGDLLTKNMVALCSDGVSVPYSNYRNALTTDPTVGFGNSIMYGYNSDVKDDSAFSAAFYITNSGTMLFGGYDVCRIYTVPLPPYNEDITNYWHYVNPARELIQESLNIFSGVHLNDIGQAPDGTVWAIGGIGDSSYTHMKIMSSSNEGQSGSWGDVVDIDAVNYPELPFIEPGDEVHTIGTKIAFSGSGDVYTIFVAGKSLSSSAGTPDAAAFVISASSDDIYNWGYSFVTGGDPGTVPDIYNVDLAITQDESIFYLALGEYDGSDDYVRTFKSTNFGYTWEVRSNNIGANQLGGYGPFIDTDSDNYFYVAYGQLGWWVIYRLNPSSLGVTNILSVKHTAPNQQGLTAIYIDDNDVVHAAGFTGSSGNVGVKIITYDAAEDTWDDYTGKFMNQENADKKGIRRLLKHNDVLFALINGSSSNTSGSLVFPFRRTKTSFFPIKTSGDTNDFRNDSNVGINYKNEFVRKLLQIKDRDNE